MRFFEGAVVGTVLAGNQREITHAIFLAGLDNTQMILRYQNCWRRHIYIYVYVCVCVCVQLFTCKKGQPELRKWET